MQAAESTPWKMETWELPPPLPRVKTITGLSICPFVRLELPSYARERHLKRAWFSRREMKSWEIQPFRRRALYRLLKRNLSNWIDWLRMDSTPTFYKDIEGFKKRQSGAVIGISGPKMCGKSRLGQMLLTRLVDTQPHVLFQYKDLEHHVKDRDELSIAIQIDEDLKATGHESRNLVVHVNNTFETSRKADLWAVCTGVNLNFKNWGDTLDLRMIPFGFNADFQATRAAVFDKENEFLGFCVFQREHLPEDHVFYYNTDGFWGEYEARARAYSLTVTKKGGVQDAVDAPMQTEHIKTLKRLFKVDFIDKGLSIPNDIMCRRLYRKAKLPSRSAGYMTEIIQWSKFELGNGSAAGSKQRKPVFVPQVTEGWNGLRTAFRDWLKISVKIRKESARYIATGETQAEIGAKYGRGVDAVNKAVGRHTDSFVGREIEYGEIAEKWVQAHTESLSSRQIGGSGKPDVLCRLDDDTEAALNVKMCLKETYRRSFTTSPECEWEHGALVVVHSFAKYKKTHRPVIRLYPITGYQTYAHWEKGVPCAPESLAERLKEMVVSG